MVEATYSQKLHQVRFEDGDKNKGDFIWIMDEFVKQDRELLAGAKPICESEKMAPLQAVDFVMWEHFRMAKTRLKANAPVAFRESFRELANIQNLWGVIDKEKLLKFCAEFGVPKRGESVRGWTPYRRRPWRVIGQDASQQ